MSQGKGISDAVRECIDTWITRDLVEQLSKVAGRPIPMYSLNNDKQWVRNRAGGRVKMAVGYERNYTCKSQPSIGLRVHTDQFDEYIKYVTFRVNDKLVGGGVVNVPSMNLSNRSGNRPAIQNMTSTVTTAKPAFRPFTAEELHRLSTNLQYANMDSMFEDRV